MDSFKYLGIKLDSGLTFNEHVKYIKGKIYAKIKLLGRVRWLLDRATALTVYKTLILPVIDYCDFIYNGTSGQNHETLQKMQNCAFRSILNVDKRAHTKDTHTSLNMDMLDTRRDKHTAIQIYKFLNDLGPTKCKSMFTYMHDYHSVVTRSSASDTLLLPKVNLSLCQCNIRYLGVKIWKKIPHEIQNAPSLESLKMAIYSHNF